MKSQVIVFCPGLQSVCLSLLSCIRHIIVNNKIRIIENNPVLMFTNILAAISAYCAASNRWKVIVLLFVIILVFCFSGLFSEVECDFFC